MKKLEKENEKRVNPVGLRDIMKLLVTPLIIIFGIIGVGSLSLYVVNRDSFTDAAEVSQIYTGNAILDPERGIVIGEENEDGTITEIEVEDVFEEIDRIEDILKDDIYSTKEEKLQYLLNAEVVSKFPYISSLEGDESKLNGTVKFYRYTNQLEAEAGEDAAEEKAVIELKSNEIFYIGDSWMEGLKSYISTQQSGEYPGNDYFLSKSGVGAQNELFANNQLKAKIDKVAKNISSIVIMLGFNDTSENGANRMGEILQFLSETYEDKTIYVLKVPHVGKEFYNNGINLTATTFNVAIDQYNKMISEFCSEIGNVRLIDSTSNMMTGDLYLDEKDTSTSYKDNGEVKERGLHLNYTGFELWYHNIKDCIANGKSSADLERFQMIYVPEKQFDQMCQSANTSNDKNIFKYFTINKEGEIVIATWRQMTKTVTTNDPEITIETLNQESSLDYTSGESIEDKKVFSTSKYTIMKIEVIQYNTLVEKYAMPFNLLWAFLIQTENYSLTAELAKLAYDGEIAIGIYDNQVTSIRTNKETYNKKLRYAENTELKFPGVGETDPSFDINDSKYEDVPRACYGVIVGDSVSHSQNIGQLDINQDDYHKVPGVGNETTNLNFGYAYVTEMTDDGVITNVSNNKEDKQYTTTVNTTNTNATNQSIGVLLVDNWMAKWKVTYSLNLADASSNGNSGMNADEDYESIPNKKISEDIFYGNNPIGNRLTKHSNDVKKAAIEKILENPPRFSTGSVLDANYIIVHFKNCGTCKGRIQTAYGKSLDDLISSGDHTNESIAQDILNNKNFNGGTAERSKWARKEIYLHANSTFANEQKRIAESRETGFKNALSEKITYTQYATAQKANVNIEFETYSSNTKYGYEKDTTIIEDEALKFKKIFNNSKYYNAKQTFYMKPDWFWEYIRVAKDTVKLEDTLRVMLNIAFDTDIFGTFTQGEIDNMFKAFEPKLQKKTGGGQLDAFKTWIKNYENGYVRYFIDEGGAYTENVAKYVTADGEYGKIYEDGALNYTYGLMIYCESQKDRDYHDDNYNGTYNNEKLFAKYGYDVKELVKAYSRGEDSNVPIVDLDMMFEDIIRSLYNHVRDTFREQGISLKMYQCLALVDICYHYGNCGEFLEGENNIVEVYKKYYIDPEEPDPEGFREHAVMEFNKKVEPIFNHEDSIREENVWIMFNEGRYILGTGEEIYLAGDYADLILEQCEIIMNELIENGIVYSVDPTVLVWNDIELSSDFTRSQGCCCATYASSAIYKAGALPASFMNEYNYHLSGSHTHQMGVYLMLRDAGWEIVEESEAQPGDICTFNDGVTGHVFIKGEGNLIWDQRVGVYSSDGTTPPTGAPVDAWNNYITYNDVVVFRAP